MTKVRLFTDLCLAELGSPWLTLVVIQENSGIIQRGRVSCAVCPPTRPARSSQARQRWPFTAGLAVTTAGAASAASLQTKPLPREAYGSVELAGPLQSESFLALQGGRHHGAVDYTNWTYAEPGSGVFAPVAGSHALVFTYQGSQYAHTLNGGLKLYALSPERLAFSGSGSYSGGAPGRSGARSTAAGSAPRSRTTGSPTRCS